MQRSSKVKTFKVGVRDHRIAPSRPLRVDKGSDPSSRNPRDEGSDPLFPGTERAIENRAEVSLWRKFFIAVRIPCPGSAFSERLSSLPLL
jgi:hypothetical protein